jgi:hypothetical protein
MLCRTCDSTLHPGAQRCGRCGTELLDVHNVPGGEREPANGTPVPMAAELTATVDRSRLSAAAADQSVAVTPVAAPSQPTAAPFQPAKAPFQPTAAPLFQPAGAPGAPSAGVTSGRAAVSRPPAEVTLVSLAMLLLAALLAYPVLRYAFPLVPSLFGNALERALAALLLFVFIIIAACVAALVALAVGMWRGSRVAQVLTILLAGAIAIGMLINGQTSGQGAQTHNATTTIIVLICLAVMALIALPPSARAFFAQDESPVGVVATAIACVYFGWCISVAGLVLTIAGTVDVKFVWWGVVFVLVGAGLTALSRPLRAGQGWARGLATLGLICYVVAGLVFATNGGDSKATGTVVQTAIGLGTVGLLWLLPSSTRHFATGPHPIGPRLPAQPIGWLALGALTVVLAGIGLSAGASQSAGATPVDTYVAQPTFAHPALPVTTAPTATSTVAAGSLDRSWTVQETGPDGYSEAVTLSVGAPQHFQPGLSQGQLAAGSACSIDASTDAVIPAQLVETNTTSGFAAHTATSFSFGMQWNSPAVEVRFAEGPQCETSGYNDHSINKLQPQTRTSSDMFFVLSGYYTPEYPAGDPSVLASATVLFAAASFTPDDGSAPVEYTPAMPSGSLTGPDGTIPLGGTPADGALPSASADPTESAPGELPGDLAEQVGPIDDGGCADHTTGRLADYLAAHGCTDMKRSLYTMTVDGRAAVISVADIFLSDPGDVTPFAELSTQNGTGDVLTLIRDGETFFGAPDSFTDDPTYLADSGGTAGEVVVLQAMWNDGSPTHADDPSLAPVLAQILPAVQ